MAGKEGIQLNDISEWEKHNLFYFAFLKYFNLYFIEKKRQASSVLISIFLL
jgi:hypothetical protein